MEKAYKKRRFILLFLLLLLLSSISLPVGAKSPPVSLVFVGDNLLHKPLAEAGKKQGYAEFYKGIRPTIAGADIAVINQETVFASPDDRSSRFKNDSISAPLLSTPTEVGEALAETGFDVINYANNHSMDKGWQGLKTTLEFWNRYPNIQTVGAKTKWEDSREVYLWREGIHFGFLAYTEETNQPLPYDAPWAVGILSHSDTIHQVQQAAKTCDFLTVLVHWGEEYDSRPTAAQRQIAKRLAAAGADLIIGTHPHVLQPVEWLSTSRGKTLVYYSLGNFFSHQNQPETLVGGLAQIEVSRKKGTVEITKAGLQPLVTHYDSQEGLLKAGVYPLSDYTPRLAARHGIHYKKEKNRFSFTVQWIVRHCREVLGDWYVPDT